MSESSDQESDRVHPLVWCAIGGGAVAVGALFVGLLISSSSNSKPQSPTEIALDKNSTTDAQKSGGRDTRVREVSPAEASTRVSSMQANTEKDAQPISSVLGRNAARDKAPSSEPQGFSFEEVLNAEPDLVPNELFRRASPSVVKIVIRNETGKPIFSGSGFVIRHHNDTPKYVEIATNYHVIKAAVDAEVEFENGERRAVWWVLSENEPHDVAILGVQSPNTIPPELYFSPELPAVLDHLIAIGTPLGLLKNTPSQGIAQGLQKLDESGIEYLQTDASISPGSSGGPLLNARGLVVGITTLTLKSGQNLNFAVPAKAVQETMRHRRPREIWRGASIEREIGSVFQRFKKQLETQSVNKSDPEVVFAETHDDIVAQLLDTKYLSKAQAARNRVPENFKFLVEAEIGSEYCNLVDKRAADEPSFEKRRRFQEYSHAITSLELAVRLDPEYGPAWFALSSCRLTGGEYTEALNAATQLVACMPRCAAAYASRGECLRWNQQIQRAIADYEAAVDLDPVSTFYYQNLGELYQRSGNLPKAVTSLESAVEYANVGIVKQQAFIALGEAYFEMGSYKKALTAYLSGDSVDNPNHIYLQARIAQCKKRLVDQ